MEILAIAISTLVLGALGCFLMVWASEVDHVGGFLGGIAGIVSICASLFAAAGIAFAGWSWVGADAKARIINREYGTSYTRSEVFWASDVIDTIREIDRKRIEINGDIARDRRHAEQESGK